MAKKSSVAGAKAREALTAIAVITFILASVETLQSHGAEHFTSVV
jgi:hypothetical protein